MAYHFSREWFVANGLWSAFAQPSAADSNDTVIESFGEEHYFGDVLLDLKVQQIVRRYTAPDTSVVAWRALLKPDKSNCEKLSGIVFEEKGAILVKRHSSPKTGDRASVVHIWEVITPDFDGSAKEPQGQFAQLLTDFVLIRCRPERVVEAMEIMLRSNQRQRNS